MKRLVTAAALLLCLCLLCGVVACSGKDTTPPSQITGIVLTGSCNSTTTGFAWDAATDADSGVDHYLVMVDGGEWTDVGNVTDYTLDAALSDGDHSVWVGAVDKEGNLGVQSGLSFTIDTAVPVIASVNVLMVTESSVTISWETSEPATSQVEYGKTTAYGSASALHGGLDVGHMVTLTGLSPDAAYHYRVKSSDACKGEATSADSMFWTAQPSTAWVNDLIEAFESVSVANPPLSIWRYTYEGQTVYYVPPRCCDIESALLDAGGKVLCHPDGGFYGTGDGRCGDFFEKRTNAVLIWRDSRSYP
jgi:hypothetical protein